MYQLTNEQINFISNDIQQKGIHLESLHDDLLDHVCCILENEMKADDDFETKYRSIIQQFYKNNLFEIEQETNQILTFKNFYFMRKVLILSGIAAASSFVAGSFFKVMHWPGAIVFFMFAMGLCSFIFLPLLFLMKNKELKNMQEKLVLGSGVIVGILYCLTVICRIQHWEIARNGVIHLLFIGFTFFVFIPFYFFNGIRKPEMKLNTIIITVLMIIFISSQFMLVDLRPLLGGMWIGR